MSAALDIGAAQVAARLVGPGEVAGALDQRLRSLLADQVLPSLSAGLADPQDKRVLCLPALPVRVQLTLADVMDGHGVDAWHAAVKEAWEAALSRGDVWAFPSRPAFLAAYLRHRLDLEVFPEAIFADVGAMRHLTPVQAVLETLRASAAIWSWLASGAPDDAARFLRRFVAQASGQSRMSLAVLAASDPAGAPPGPSQDLVAEIHDFTGRISASLAAVFRAAAKEGGVAHTAVLARLLADPERMVGPETAAVAALVTSLANEPKFAGKGFSTQSVAAVLAKAPKALRASLRQSWSKAMATEGGEAAIAALAARLAPTPATARTHGRRDGQGDHATRAPDAETGTQEASPFAEHAPREADLGAWETFFSPVAGAALCLPFLTENRIGLSFPAAERFAALCRLGGTDEDDPALRVLAGDDPRPITPPDRPNATDLLFVPSGHHTTIRSAPPGGPRLAAWAMARLAVSLPGLAASSPAYLTEQFLARPGSVHVSEEAILVEIERMPLALVIELSGLLEAGRWRLDWLGGRTLTLALPEAAS